MTATLGQTQEPTPKTRCLSETYKTTDIDDVNKDPVVVGVDANKDGDYQDPGDTKPNTPNLSSETFYKGAKGDEVANYTYNYQTGTLNVKSTSVFFYGSSVIRASDGMDTELSMSRSLAYKDKVDTDDLADITITAGDIDELVKLTSDTHYYGDVTGEEIAHYAYNYAVNKNLGSYIESLKKTTTVYFYGDNQLEADDGATTEDAMTRSDTRRAHL